MIRVFLVHLGRFFRMLLVATFVSVLAVPLIFGALEIIFGRFARQDVMYLVCAGGAVGASFIYTWYSRNRVNSDEVLFFVRNRMVASRRMFYHLLTIQAMAVYRVGGVDLQERIDELFTQLKDSSPERDTEHHEQPGPESSSTTGGTSDGTTDNSSASRKDDRTHQEKSSSKARADDESEAAAAADAAAAAGAGAAGAAAGESASADDASSAHEAYGQAGGTSAGAGDADSRCAVSWAVIIKWPDGAYSRGRSSCELLMQAREQACEEALAHIASFMASTGAQGRRLERGSRVYLSALLDRPDPAREDSFLKAMNRQCGPYLCELTFVLIIRTLMSVEPFKKGFIDYRLILEQPLVKHWGSLLLGVPEDSINADYYNRYFFLLNQEQARIRESWIIQQMQAAAAAQAAAAPSASSASGNAQGGSHSSERTDSDDTFNGSSGHYSYSYTYSNGQWYYQGSTDYSDNGSTAGAGSRSGSSGNSSDRARAQGASASSGADSTAGDNGAAGAGRQWRERTGSTAGASGGGRFLSRLEKAYITLGLEFNSPLDKVKRQYRRLAFKYHPDHIADYDSFSQSQKEELNAQFLAIVAAYEIIMKDQASRIQQ
ncbi:J domain-containing protein [Anaerobiospirillum sp. NML120449]|uniref:J domain-containing protein n=1 Tax=Anaerobiospirillum sp. NML120449 TaxID=2932817 RepID=UPI001FF6A11E|nr:J domain-containing protein [Anaerobiospirillum sp. NML120449]MCK0526607.1 J domain-containing protein [Anaerobiospirillum sp. NML120449]